MKTVQLSLILVLFLQLCACAKTEFHADKDLSRNLWLSPDRKTVLAIEACGTGLCGRIAGMRPNYGANGALLQDVKNESLSMRMQHVCGMKVFRNLHWSPKLRAWEGHIYYPQTGRHYPVQIATGKTGQLFIRTELEGPRFFGMSWLSQTETWTRYNGETKDDCTVLERIR